MMMPPYVGTCYATLRAHAFSLCYRFHYAIFFLRHDAYFSLFTLLSLFAIFFRRFSLFITLRYFFAGIISPFDAFMPPPRFLFFRFSFFHFFRFFFKVFFSFAERSCRFSC